MKREKVLLAIGIPELENEIRNKFNNKKDIERFEILDDVIIHSDPKHIFNKINNNNPDIIVFREGLSGNHDLVATIYSIAKNYDIRIIFLAKRRVPGDKLLATMTMYSVYDILTGTEININQIINIIKNPNTIKDVIEYLPKPSSTDDYNTLLFDQEEDSNKEDHKQINKSPYGSIKGKQVIETDLVVDNTKINIKKDNGEDKEKEKLLKMLAEEKKKREEMEKALKMQSKSKKRTKGVDPKLLAQIKKKEEQEKKKIEREKLKLQKEKEALESKFKNLEKEKMEIKKKQEKVISKDNKVAEGKDGVSILDAFGSIFKNDANNTKGKVENRQRIISFYNVKNGLGSTFISLNSAIEIAKKGYKVLYIELDNLKSSTSLWYDIEDKKLGLEDALSAINHNEYKDINDSIISKNDILVQKSDLISTHNKLPNTLDFLLFTEKHFNSSIKQNINNQSLQQLLIYLMYQLGYNYIVIDINFLNSLETIESLLLLSYKNVILFNQDILTVSMLMQFLNDMEDKGLKGSFSMGENSLFKDKNLYLINYYSKKARFNLKSITAWTGIEKFYTIPYNLDDVYDALLIGNLILDSTKNQDFKKDFNNLINSL